MLTIENEWRKQYHDLIDKVFESGFWSDGGLTKKFEEKFAEFTALYSAAISSGGTGLLAILDYVDVRGHDVLLPSNTFWATAMAVKKAGGNPVYVDCNRYDLCMSYEDMLLKLTQNTKAVVIVHIGGHIAFEIEKIATYCDENSIALIEDCAHAHGAEYHGKSAGSWGVAGSYSFYATKTMPTGEGGMVVSKDPALIEWMKMYRNYGKKVVDGKVTYPLKDGFNYRISEFTAALGIVQLKRLPEVLEWKRHLARKYDAIFENRVTLPESMMSGYYKYIIFGYKLKEETGKVFACSDQCVELDEGLVQLPNTKWVCENHQCPPIYYGWKNADLNSQLIKRKLFYDEC